MEIKKIHWAGMIASMLFIIISLIFMNTNVFFFFVGIAVLIAFAPFVFTVIYENKIAAQKEEMFLEFARNLVESVKTGAPISKSIINMKNKPYGVLSQHIKKLANQISLGIPLNEALRVFSDDVDTKSISRVLTLIGQAERAGGDIGEILESVAAAVNLSDSIKKERKAVISTLVVQGYIIFLVFMVIILVMQFKILPLLSGIADLQSAGTNVISSGLGSEGAGSIEEISKSFLYLILIQGFFSGLTIGKLSEGSIKAGIKHSFALMVFSFLISSVAGFIFG